MLTEREREREHLLRTRARARSSAAARSLPGAVCRRALGAMSDGAAGDPPAPEPAPATAATTVDAAAASADPSAPAAAGRAAPPASPDAARKGKATSGSAPKRRFAAGRVSVVWMIDCFFFLFDGATDPSSSSMFFFSVSLVFPSFHFAPSKIPLAGSGRRRCRRERR